MVVSFLNSRTLSSNLGFDSFTLQFLEKPQPSLGIPRKLYFISPSSSSSSIIATPYCPCCILLIETIILPSTTFSFGKISIDFKGQSVKRAGKLVDMSAREFKLLKFLVENKGKVLDRSAILNRVWGYDYYGTSRTVDNFINRLRQKIEEDHNKPKFITTVFGVGYKFEVL